MMDLANEIIKKTYHKSYAKDILPINYRTADYMRKHMMAARRFVLDASMSEFMAELATVPFSKVAPERRPEVLSSLRHSARLPFPKMFVQFDGHAFREGLLNIKASKDFWGHQIVPANEDVLKTIGWLIEQGTVGGAPSNIIWISEWFEFEGSCSTLPFYWAYKLDDEPFPDRETFNRATHDINRDAPFVDTEAGMFAHGITGYHDTCIGINYPAGVERFPKHELVKFYRTENDKVGFDVHSLVPEFGGVIRYALAFLATLNDTPKREQLVEPTKTYFVGGQFRKPVAHTMLTLNLSPKTTMRKLATRLIAAVRKGHHEVRPHWRVYHVNENQPHCDRVEHVWSEEDLTGRAHCTKCAARRVWVTLPNGRGDTSRPVPERSRYYVTHHGDAQ